jgi:hypothetical protein
MPFVSIPWIHTADPSNVWNSKSAFRPADPFAIVMNVRVSDDIIAAGLRFDAVFQMVTPRNDPYGPAWYTVFSTGESDTIVTLDWRWDDLSFTWGTDFGLWVYWDHYSDAISHVRGGEKDRGIFFVRGTVDIRGSDLFAHSPEFWYKVRNR